MGYVIVTAVLKDGRRIERAAVVGLTIVSIEGEPTIPFTENEIAEFIVTHDKRKLRGSV